MEISMSQTSTDQTERLVQFSRRQLWFVLVFLLVLGAGHMVDLYAPTKISALVGVPIFLVAFFAMPSLKATGIDFSGANPAMQALRNDELRQFALAKAFRNGFFVLLAYPPLCAFALTGLAVANPLPAVVASGAWLGAVVFLASVLWYDR
jgi:hypothetical protein